MVLTGDCRETLRTLPTESVHCVVTSPPYWGLRDYGLPPLVWGGSAGCEHEWGSELPHTKGTGGHSPKQDSNKGSWQEGETTNGSFCRRCGAWRGSLGLEPTPELYVQHMVEVFREVRRVMRDDATLWLNMGDSYNNKPGNPQHTGDAKWNGKKGAGVWAPGLKPKDLCGIPWRLAFALQADGWWLRSDIIWHKTNPMPESVRDRPTKAHEYLFLLSKSKRYHYDADAVREPAKPEHAGRYKSAMYVGDKESSGAGRPNGAPNTAGMKEYTGKRNRRSVWRLPTQPFKGAHFATFPEALVEPCIKAGCPEGGTVLDPFGGSGTVGVVATRLGRDFILCELNPEYVGLAAERLAQVQPRLV